MVRRVALAMGALLVVACGDARPVSSVQQTRPVGPPTNTTVDECIGPDLSGFTYANFGQSFFTSYCLRCHSVTKTGAARNGAPDGYNFDTFPDVFALKEQIDQVAGMNPDGTRRNITMPFDPPTPTDLQRQQLACWIATGLP
jgi:uncharacterized membrane protein